MSAGDGLRYFKYICMNKRCGAEDRGRFYPGERVAQVINCHQCHAGMQMNTEQMMAQGQGMLITCELDADGQEMLSADAAIADAQESGRQVGRRSVN